MLTVLAGNPDDGGAYGVAGTLGDDLTVSYTNVFTSPYGDSDWQPCYRQRRRPTRR